MKQNQSTYNVAMKLLFMSIQRIIARYITVIISKYFSFYYSWINRQPLPSPCCHANLVIVDDQLYLIGGSNMEETSSAVTSLSNVYLYNEDRDTWTKISDLPVPRHDAGVGVVGMILFFFNHLLSSFVVSISPKTIFSHVFLLITCLIP